MSVTFFFTSFAPSKLKKLSTLRYRDHMEAGIVNMDGLIFFRPSNKHLHHGGAVRCYSGMAVANDSPLPQRPGRLFGLWKGYVGQGWYTRVLFIYADRPR